MNVTAALTKPQHGIVRAASIVMVFFVASRLLGVLRDVVISRQFGTSRVLDAYFAAFNIPDLIFGVVAGGALGSAFIPTFGAALAHGDTARAWRLASSILNVAFVFLSVTCGLLAIFAPQVVAATVARGFSPEDQELTANLMRWMLVCPVVFGVSGIIMGILNSHHHFVLPALAPVLYNAAIIGGALFLAPTFGVYGLAAGVVAGAILHLIVQLPWLVRHKMAYSLSLGLDNADVREVGRLMLPRTIGLAAVQINFLVNTILASGLAAGRIAALGYAWRIMLLPEGIVALSLATAIFPTLSMQSARQEKEEFRSSFSTAFRTTLYLTIPAAVGLIILGSPLIALLFQRGEFDANSTAETAYALQFYALGLFAHSGLEIVTRAYYAMHDTKTPVALSLASVAVNILLSLALIGPLAHGGLALANSIATILEMLTLVFLLRRKMGHMDDRRILRSVAWSLVGAAIMALVLVLIQRTFAEANTFIIMIIGMVAGGLVYIALTAVLGSEEAATVIRMMRLPLGLK